MLTHAVPHRPADAGQLASVRHLCAHAEVLRDGAEAPVLTTGQRTVLLRDAEAAERQARRRLRTSGHVDVARKFHQGGGCIAPDCECSGNRDGFPEADVVRRR